MSPSWRAAAAAVLGVLVALPIYAHVAPLDAPEARSVVPGTVVLDVHGSVLEHDAANGLRIPVALDAIAPRMLQATVSAEDRRFWQHPGVDPLAMARALAQLPSQPSGASTITQQLARRLYLGDDASALPVRKAHEALIALQLEARRSKADILGLYLNDVYYGRGAYGVEAAARTYFGISAANLDLAHASYLAGLPQRPSSYDSPDGSEARARQSYVLARMLEDGWITAAEGAAALAVAIDVLPPQGSPAARAFVSYALGELARVRPDLAGRAGLTVETTLDAGLQAEVERMVRLRLAELKDRNVTDAAVVAIEP
ncbi:MAG TPA: transglycosylase domain-containing protein, partial [Coriobacteriia bacterium]